MDREEYMQGRDIAGVPDEYVGDEHLLNWFKKNLGMTELLGVFVHPTFVRRDLTADELDICSGGYMYLVFPKHNIELIISEWLDANKRANKLGGKQ